MILMDATPIIFLAKINRLDLLLALGLPIFLTKEVEYETTTKQAVKENRDQNNKEKLIAKFFADQTRLKRLLKRLFIIKTIVCEIVEQKRKENPNYHSSGDGEVASNSLFLNRKNYGIDGPALLLYEDTDTKAVFKNEDVYFLTTYGLLVAMEKKGHIESANEEWKLLNLQYENFIAPNYEDLSNREDTEYIINQPTYFK